MNQSNVQRISELIMKKNLLASLLIAATASIAVPAFASGYGPAPSYRPQVSQSGSSNDRTNKSQAVFFGQ
jgi:hypothetical protein